MFSTDLVVREFANGFWFVALFGVGLIFVRFALHQRRELGALTIRAQASLLVGLFMMSAAIMRFWAWAFLWQANHGWLSTWREGWWMALLSMVLGSVILPFLIYRITPPRSGHGPWIGVLLASWGLPALFFIIPELFR